MGLPLPPFDVNGLLAPFVIVAVSMVAVTIVVLGLVRPSDRKAPLVTQMLLAVAVVGGGSLLLLALLFVFLDPNGTSAWTWVLLAFNFMMMVPVGLWFVGHIVFRDRRIVPGSWVWPVGLGVAVTGSEVLMGLLFVIGGVSASASVGTAFTLGLSSVWFFWSMATVMAPQVAWAPLSPLGRAAGWALVAAAGIGPWVRAYPLVGGIAMSALMVAAFVALLRPIARGGAAGADGRLLLALAGAFLGMSSAGLAVAATGGSEPAVLAFGAVMAFVMIGEVSYLLRRTYAPGLSASRLAALSPSRGAEASAGPAGPAPES